MGWKSLFFILDYDIKWMYNITWGDWLYFPVERQKFTANVVVGLPGNKSPYSNRLILVFQKPENGVRLQATFGSRNPAGKTVGVVKI